MSIVPQKVCPCYKYPGYKCPDRSAKCHASCEKYLEWREERIEECRKEKAFEDSNKEFYTEGKIRFIEKGLKKKHSKGILRNIK